MTNWELRDYDQEFFERELADFVPARIFDAHAHLYRASDWGDRVPADVLYGPAEVTLEAYSGLMRWIFPDRELHGLYIPFPGTWRSFATAGPNGWVAGQVSGDRQGRGLFLVRPEDDPEWARQEVHRLGFHGLKPYATFADVPDPFQAHIPDFLPEPLVAVANEEGWPIVLHMMRRLNTADPENQHWIRHYCETYPHMQLILAHSARGFNPYHALRGLQALTGLDNLWFDTSACCAPEAHMACLKYLRPERALYGSDFYMSHVRGTNFAVNQEQYWLTEDSCVFSVRGSAEAMGLTFVGFENLRSVHAAFTMLDLGDDAIEDYFWGNAACLLEL
jgi:hypothetical protein